MRQVIMPILKAATTTNTSCTSRFWLLIRERAVKINNIVTEKIAVMIAMFIFAQI